MGLFVQQTFEMHSGGIGYFKIDCDALTDEDWKTLAFIVSKEIKFSMAVGVPTGGLKFAAALKSYQTDDGPVLIVDDVLTTGASMYEARKIFTDNGIPSIGIVAFARQVCPAWVIAVFQLSFLEGN